MAENPNLAELIADAITSRLLDVHVAMPGRVKSYDRETQTAEVIPVIKNAAPMRDGSTELEELPVLPNVPVKWPRGGGYYMHFPLAPGDHVLLIFCEAAIAQWRETGEVSPPGDLRRHSLSYPYAVPGVAPDAEAFSDAPESEALMAVGSGGSLRVSEPGMGSASEFVVLTEKLMTALSGAADAAVAGVTPNDGGAKAFGVFKSTIQGSDFASTVLKAQG